MLHCRVVSCDVILAYARNFPWMSCLLLKSSSITCLPNMPLEVDYDSVKTLPSRFIKGGSTSPPITIDGATLVYVLNMGYFAPSLYYCPGLLCEQRCYGVSGSTLHNLQIGSFGLPLLIRLFAVRIFWWSKVQAKNLHFFLSLLSKLG